MSRLQRQEDPEPERGYIPGNGWTEKYFKYKTPIVIDNILTCFLESSISEEKARWLKKCLRPNSQPLSQVEAYMEDTVL